MRSPVGLHAIADFAGVREDGNVVRHDLAQDIDQPFRPGRLRGTRQGPDVNPSRPIAIRRDRLEHGGDRGAGVGDDADGDRVIDADLVGIEIDLNQVPRDRHASPIAEYLGKAAANGQHGIRMIERKTGARRTTMTKRQWVALIDQALAIECGHDGRIEGFGQGRISTAAFDQGASPREDDRASRAGQDFRPPRDGGKWNLRL